MLDKLYLMYRFSIGKYLVLSVGERNLALKKIFLPPPISPQESNGPPPLTPQESNGPPPPVLKQLQTVVLLSLFVMTRTAAQKRKRLKPGTEPNVSVDDNNN